MHLIEVREPRHLRLELQLHRAGRPVALLADARMAHLEGVTPAARLRIFKILRIWVTDPEKGTVNIASDIRLAIWDAFHENGIEFPFPQRDLHIASAPGLEDLADRFAGKGKGEA